MKGFKTFLVAGAVMVLGLLEQLTPGTLTQIIPDQYDGFALALLGAVMAGLRLVTNTPAGKKE